MNTGVWLTAARVGRLPDALRAIRGYAPPGIPEARVERIVWRACGGPLDEIHDLIGILVRSDLVSAGPTLKLTREGRHIATQDHQQGGTLLGRTLIRVGFFADQVRRLTEHARIDPASGELCCARKVALDAGPQLVGVLRRFPGVTWGAEFRVPAVLVEELMDVWALLPERAPVAEDRRKAIGDRGELYSYRLERLRCGDSSKIRWVARDDDSLGYDIEDMSVTPQRRIEAKASTAREVRFILSANEWEVAHRYGDDYEVHFWGRVDVTRQPADEYQALRKAGYPIVFKNVVRLHAEGRLTARPLQYQIQEVLESGASEASEQ